MLHLHRSERADALVAALAAVLSRPLDDPFAEEVVAVPTRGVERWLSQQLAAVLGARPGAGDGVCANVVFPFPERLLAAALSAAHAATVASTAGAGSPGRLRFEPPGDPWSPERAVWPLIEVVDQCSGEPWSGVLVAHLERAGRGQRFAALRHVADLFDRYGVHRPAMVRAWAAGRADGTGELRGAAGAALPDDLVWQAELWCRLRERIGVPSPAERLVEACRAIAEGRVEVDVPARVSLFGLTRLPPSYLEVLRALASERQVHLFLLHPSPVLWDTVAARLDEAEDTPAETVAAPPRRRQDPTAELARNPLLASWGRDAREMQVVLRAASGNAAGGAAGGGVHHPSPEPSVTTLLGRIQADIRANRPPPGRPLPGAPDERLLLAAGDDSVQVHDCHGRGRQVEVLRDAVLGLLAADPTLEPRDVVVMCPDIESWAPLIRAAFDGGAAAAEPGRSDPVGELRVRLADRSLRQTNPLFAVLSELLELAGSRLTASQVLDLAAMAPVRRRFVLDDDELGRVRGWVAAAGVRWGIDAAHRAGFGLGSLEANSWRSGLDRLLLGVAVAEEECRLVGGVLPLDDVVSAEVELAGRFAELVERLATTLDELQPPGEEPLLLTVAAWAGLLREGLDRLALAAEPERWQRLQVDRLLDEVAGEAAAGPGAAGVGVTLAELRSLLGDRLRGRPSRANFRTGQLTICTLVPMRSVPHRVVCLLGMDDGAFPRAGVEDGDDLVSRDPWVGDRDLRGEDRQLLLDAVLAAGEHLVVTYRGRDERTNASRPPAVPVGELIDVVDATARLASGERASSRVVVRHPLQAFDPRCFVPGELVPGRPWSFDAVALDGARAALGPRAARLAFLAEPLPPLEEEVVELAALVRFVQQPVATFLRRRLGLRLGERDEDVLDALPVELSGLDGFRVGDRLLRGRTSGLGRGACEAAERARGELPPGALADLVLAKSEKTVDELLAAWEELVDDGSPAVTLDVQLPLAGGSLLAGSVPGVRGGALCGIGYARLAPGKRLAAWVQLLALAAARPDEVTEAVTIGRVVAGTTRTVAVSSLHPPEGGADAARELLGQLVDLYRAGMRRPLPIAERTSEAWAAAARRARLEAAEGAPPRDGPDPVLAAARACWHSGDRRRPGEDEAPEQLLAFGRRRIDELLAEPAGDDELAPPWPAGERGRFAGYARRLWDPLLEHERLSQR